MPIITTLQALADKLAKALLLSLPIYLLSTSATANSDTLTEVQKRGKLNCGVSTGLLGFSSQNENGKWYGIDVDICRAVAAATLGDDNKVKYISLNDKERFEALTTQEVDILSKNSTWTLHRDTSLKLNFAGVNFYDGQGFMVRKDLNISRAADLNNVVFCVQSATTTFLNLKDYMATYRLKADIIELNGVIDAIKAFEGGRCDALTSDRSQLFSVRLKLSDPTVAAVLPEVISKEPLGPVVREGDDRWFNIVKWSLFAMINAEELGINSNNVDTMLKSKNPAIRRIIEDENSKALGLNPDWAYQIIKQVGNYGEVYSRNVGNDSALQIERGLNRLWNKGGIMYAPPFR